MKRFLILLLTAFALTQCSTEPEIVPLTPEEDLKTTATLYADQFLTIDVSTRTHEDGIFPVYFYIAGNGGTIKVNWGDGSYSSYVIGEVSAYVDHDYTEDGNYKIQISGDIKTITAFATTSYTYYDVHKIHFGGLVNLQYVWANIVGPEVINLSRNRELRTVNLTGLFATKDILLPSTNKITSLNINASKHLSTAVVDRLISRIYDSVLKSPRTGSINVSLDGYHDEPGTVFLGPPSSWSINKLRTLQNKYHWNVNPKIQ